MDQRLWLRKDSLKRQTSPLAYFIVLSLVMVSIGLYSAPFVFNTTLDDGNVTDPNYKDGDELRESFHQVSGGRLGLGTDLLGVVSFFASISVVFVAVFLGLFLSNRPQSLAGLVRDKKQWSVGKDGGSDLVREVPGGNLRLSWHSTRGLPQHWKLRLSLEHSDPQSSSPPQLAQLLLMTSTDDHSCYEKVFPAREWPRQELLVQYWQPDLQES